MLTESPGTNHVREWYSRSDVLAMQVAHSRKLIALQSACERRLQQASAYWKARNKAIAESAIEKSVVLARQLKPTKGGGGNNLNIDGDPSVRAILRGGGAAFPQPDPPPGAPSAEIIEDMKDLDAGAAAAIAAVTSDGYGTSDTAKLTLPFRSMRFMSSSNAPSTSGPSRSTVAGWTSRAAR